jgi:hypothetical protein
MISANVSPRSGAGGGDWQDGSKREDCAALAGKSTLNRLEC